MHVASPMSCKTCGAVWYSTAAAEMVERGDRCLECDGHLELGVSEPPRPTEQRPTDNER